MSNAVEMSELKKEEEKKVKKLGLKVARMQSRRSEGGREERCKGKERVKEW